MVIAERLFKIKTLRLDTDPGVGAGVGVKELWVSALTRALTPPSEPSPC